MIMCPQKHRRTFIRLFTALLLIAFSSLPAFAEVDYGTIEIHDTANLERTGWPIQVGVPVAAEADADALQLVRVDEDGALHEAAFQVLDTVEPVHDPDQEPPKAIKTVEIAFLVDLPSGGSLQYRLYEAEPDEKVTPRQSADDMPQLEIEHGEHLGRVVDTGDARFGFHHNSGQLISYRLAGASHEPDFNGQAAHGGADVALGRVGKPPKFKWGAVRKWKIEESAHRIEYNETAGPIAWSMTRTGLIPDSNETEVALSYTLFAGAPYIIETSEMRFTRNTAVRGVRNNHLVFLRGHHTHGVYIDHDGSIATARAYNPEAPETKFERMGVDPLPPDIPFMGFFHESRGHGIGMVTLDRFNYSPGSLAANRDSGAFYYFYDAMIHNNPERDFFYFVRTEVAPESYGAGWPWDYTVIPAGTVFATRSAILAFPFDVDAEEEEARFEILEHWTKLLRHPPKVAVR